MLKLSNFVLGQNKSFIVTSFLRATMDAYILAVNYAHCGFFLGFSRGSQVTLQQASPCMCFFLLFSPPKQSNLLFSLIAALVGVWTSLTCFNW